MTVDDGRRRQLHEQLTESVGPEATATMFELLPPAGAGPATSADIAELSGRMDRGFAHVNGRVDRLEDRMGSLEESVDGLQRTTTELQGAVAELQRAMTGLTHAVDRLPDQFRAELRGEILTAVTSQTRAVLLAVLTTLLGVAGLAWSFSQLG